MCELKRPRAKQKSVYGASFGGLGRGSCAMGTGLRGSRTSITHSGSHDSLQSGLSDSATLIVNPRLSVPSQIVWNGMPSPPYNGEGSNLPISFGFLMSEKSWTSMPNADQAPYAMRPPSSMRRVGIDGPWICVYGMRSSAGNPLRCLNASTVSSSVIGFSGRSLHRPATHCHFFISFISVLRCPGTHHDVTGLGAAGSLKSMMLTQCESGRMQLSRFVNESSGAAATYAYLPPS